MHNRPSVPVVFRIAGCFASSLAFVASPLLAQVGPHLVSGAGYADITADVGAVKAAAESAARQALAKAILDDAIGSQRAAQISEEVIRSISDQILPAMIASQEGRREGERYKVTILANIDKAWLKNQLSIRGIQSGAQSSGASGRLIFVMLDQHNSIGRDYNKPQEIITNYSASKGASFSDKSIFAASDKEKAGYSSRAMSGSTARSSSAVGVSTRRGSAAGRSSSSAASASSERASSAYSKSTSAIQKNNVQAKVHDDINFRQEIRMQKVEARSQASDYALSAMSRELVNYGVEFADAGPSLNSYFGGKRPLWLALKSDPRLAAFETSLAAKQGAFFMGGSLTVQDTSSGGVFTCTGTLEARVSATSNGRVVASGAANGSASDINSAERCEAKLADKLSSDVVGSIGPQVKMYWLSGGER